MLRDDGGGGQGAPGGLAGLKEALDGGGGGQGGHRGGTGQAGGGGGAGGTSTFSKELGSQLISFFFVSISFEVFPFSSSCLVSFGFVKLARLSLLLPPKEQTASLKEFLGR